MKTYSPATWFAVNQAWATGGYGSRWDRIRMAAAERGFAYPPKGTADDDRDDESPSPRAIIWRALTDNPKQLEAIVWRSTSWYDVVHRIVGLEERLRMEAEHGAAVDETPTRREAMSSLAAILRRIEEVA